MFEFKFLFLGGVIGFLGWMLVLAEKDAAYWHGEAQEVPLLRETTRIQGIILENKWHCTKEKRMKLTSPIRRKQNEKS